MRLGVCPRGCAKSIQHVLPNRIQAQSNRLRLHGDYSLVLFLPFLSGFLLCSILYLSLPLTLFVLVLLSSLFLMSLLVLLLMLMMAVLSNTTTLCPHPLCAGWTRLIFHLFSPPSLILHSFFLLFLLSFSFPPLCLLQQGRSSCITVDTYLRIFKSL